MRGGVVVLLTAVLGTALSAAPRQSLSGDQLVNYSSSRPTEADAEKVKLPRVFPKKVGAEDPITRLYGIPDQEALVGHAFTFAIPEDAFQGPVDHYTVSGLPPWLQYLNSSATIVGVAPREAVGEQLYISVIAHTDAHEHHHHSAPPPVLSSSQPHLDGSDAPHNHQHHHDPKAARDTFAITVLKRHGRIHACRVTEPFLRLTVHSSTPLLHLTPERRVLVIHAFARLTGLTPQAITLVPSRSARTTTHPRGTELRVTVGCGVRVLHQAAVDRVNATEATLSDVLGLTVTGWHLSPVEATPTSASARRAMRNKRSPDYAGGSASGDYPDNYYDYEYEYDDYDPNYSGINYDEPEERVVPSLATPVFTGTATATVAPSGGTDEDPLLPPVLRPVPISTPVFVPVKPTRVVEASPTVATPSYSTSVPSQPSILVEPTRPLVPSSSVAPTQPLPPSGTPTTSTGPYIPPTSSSTSPAPPPQVTDHLVRNFPPEVSKRIEKKAWTAGFVYRFKIPEDTFQDMEDGNTRNLRLVLLDRSESTLGTESWIQFDPVNQEIYALPLENDTGYWTFYIEAVDSGGKTVRESIKIHIHQPKEARNYLHKYTATMRIAKKYEYDFTFALDWHINVVRKIAALFDNNTDSINIRSISENPTKVAWTNVTIVDPQATTCPEHEIDYMNGILFGDSQEHEVSREVVEAFKPEFHLKRLHVHYTSHCEHRHSRPPVQPDTNVEEPSVTDMPPRNKEPHFMNQVDIVRATAGVFYRQQVPADACYDLEDGSARNLRMRLLTSNLYRLSPEHWLQFDESNQEFFGLPLAGDVGSNEFILECLDSEGAKTSDSLEVVVDPSPITAAGAPQPPILITLTFENDYDTFMRQPRMKASLIRRIGTAFGDDDGSHVSVSELSRGSIVVSWHNTSLSSTGSCPNEDIQQIRDVMLTRENALKAEFPNHFLPDFVLSDARITPTGACLSPDTPLHVPPPDVGSNDVFENGDQSAGVSDEQPTQDDYLLTFLVPSILMAAMLVLAAIAACFLYRHRRRYAKMSLTNHAAPPDTTTFVTTGIPVILAEEMDDPSMAARTPLAKTPVIMKDEKPPLPPYRQSPPPLPSNNTGSRRPDHQQQQQQPYQQPPPPFTNGRNSPRSNTQPPAYRKPTYMPP